MAKLPSPAPDGLWTALIKRLAWPIIIVSLILTGLSVYYSLTRLHFSLSRTELVASDLHLIRLTQELEREFGERDQFVVVMENRDKDRTIAFAEALAARLNLHRDRFPEIFYRVDPEPFRKWALQYLEVKELEELKTKLTEHRHILEAIAAEPTLTRFFQEVNQEITRAMISEVFTSFLEDKEEEPIPDLTLFNATLRELERSLTGQGAYRSPLKTLFPGALGDISQEGYFFTDNDKYLLFLVTTRQDGFTDTYEDLAFLRAQVAAVKAQFPDTVVGVTGPVALSADEMAGAFADINLASWLSFFLQVAVMVIFFRSLKRPLVQGIVLAVGIAWTMGVATLVVGRLNILSIVFAPLMLGICVDFGIHWYSRLEEEQGSLPYCHDLIFERTVRGANPGNFYAALAALFSILPLAFAGFQGLAELGIIVSLGILVYLVAIFVLLPALAYVTEGCRRRQDRTEPPPPATPEPFFSLNWAKPEVVVALGLLVTVLGTISLWFVPFDLNPLRLQNQRTESVVWELKILEESRYSSSYGTMVSTDLAELPRKVVELKAKPTVSHVESILSFLPKEPESKLPLIRDLAPILTQVRFAPEVVSDRPVDLTELGAVLGRIRFKLSQAKESDWKPGAKPAQEQLEEANRLLSRLVPLIQAGGPELPARALDFQRHLFADFRDKWDLLVSNLGSGSPTIADLPQAVRQRFVSPQEHYLIRIFPSIDIWDPEPLGRFVADLQSVDPNVVGDPVLLYVFNFAFKNACLWAAGVALLAIFLLLWFLLRSLSFALLALIPLFVGTALTLCLMWILGLTFNQANVLFLPLILGEGIEYGIIILVRWKLEASARAITLPRSTAKGVALASLTTALGFGSMMISGHQGTFSLGLLSTVGSLSVLVAALTVLPAFLRVLERVLLPTPVPCPRALASTDD